MHEHRTLELNGDTYRIAKLDALRAFHVTRRLAPLLVAFATDTPRQGGVDAMVQALPQLAQALASMKDEDADFVLFTALSVVSRAVPTNTGTSWASVTTQRSLMFHDIALPTLLQLMVEALREELSSFFTMVLGAAPMPAASPNYGQPGVAAGGPAQP